MDHHDEDVLRVLYVDPASPGAEHSRDFHGCDHRRPARTIALTAPAGDRTPSGLYKLNGQTRRGRWVYELSAPTVPTT